MSEYSHLTSYVKITSFDHAGIGGRSGRRRRGRRQLELALSLNCPCTGASRESGSTSKPTMRAPVKVSRWNLTMKRRWLFRYGLPGSVPGAIGLGAHEAEREAAVVHVLLGAVGHLGDHLRGRGQVVHDHVDAVVLPHLVRRSACFCFFLLSVERHGP